MTEENKEAAEERENMDRISPQKVYDQGETVQVGGTVINENLNRDENKTDADDEEHNYNETDPENEHYNPENLSESTKELREEDKETRKSAKEDDKDEKKSAKSEQKSTRDKEDPKGAGTTSEATGTAVNKSSKLP